jgi:hypothetical protein
LKKDSKPFCKIALWAPLRVFVGVLYLKVCRLCYLKSVIFLQFIIYSPTLNQMTVPTKLKCWFSCLWEEFTAHANCLSYSRHEFPMNARRWQSICVYDQYWISFQGIIFFLHPAFIIPIRVIYAICILYQGRNLWKKCQPTKHVAVRFVQVSGTTTSTMELS